MARKLGRSLIFRYCTQAGTMVVIHALNIHYRSASLALMGSFETLVMVCSLNCTKSFQVGLLPDPE